MDPEDLDWMLGYEFGGGGEGFGLLGAGLNGDLDLGAAGLAGIPHNAGVLGAEDHGGADGQGGVGQVGGAEAGGDGQGGGAGAGGDEHGGGGPAVDGLGGAMIMTPRGLEYNMALCHHRVANGHWDHLNSDLRSLLLLEGVQAPAGTNDPGRCHPVLSLFVRKEAVLSLLRLGRFEEAQQYFTLHVEPLANASGPYLPRGHYVRNTINTIHLAVVAQDGFTSTMWPHQSGIIAEKILDYLRLYFPGRMGHNMLEGRRSSPTWNLSRIIRNAADNPIKVNGKTQYVCLACGWDKGSTRGIKSLERHLLCIDGTETLHCLMTTPRIFEILSAVPPADLFAQDHIHEEQAVVNNQNAAYQHPVQAPGGQQVPHAPDPVLPLQIAQPQGQAPIPVPAGFIEVSVVLDAHLKLSRSLSLITRSLGDAPAGITGTDFQPSRGDLLSITEICSNGEEVAGHLVVAAESILTLVQSIGYNMLPLRNALFSVKPQLRTTFVQMERDINALEANCLLAQAHNA